jgi:hypothetical protein
MIAFSQIAYPGVARKTADPRPTPSSAVWTPDASTVPSAVQVLFRFRPSDSSSTRPALESGSASWLVVGLVNSPSLERTDCSNWAMSMPRTRTSSAPMSRKRCRMAATVAPPAAVKSTFPASPAAIGCVSAGCRSGDPSLSLHCCAMGFLRSGRFFMSLSIVLVKLSAELRRAHTQKLLMTNERKTRLQ